MSFTPFNSIDEMLAHVKEAKVLDDTHPAQKNALLNHFIYKKYVSSNHQTLIVKEFDHSSYNGPTTNDFIKRLNIISEAAKEGLNPQQVKKLKFEQKKIADAIHETGQIEPINNIDDLLIHEKKLIKTINTAQQLLQEFVLQIILIKDPDAFTNKMRIKKILANMKKQESTLIAKKGRPNFINYYPITNTTETTRVSINRVIGHAIPSTERLTKLPNFVECGVGYMKEGHYVSQFKGYRHSSYTPIKMIDKTYGDSNYHRLFSHQKTVLSAVNNIKFERRQAAALCAKEMFTELARQHIAKDPNVKDPIQINLSSLALLSAIRGDKMFMSRGQSEHRQLKESYNALMMYDGRSVEIDVDGKKITVMPSINIMNAASNWHGIKLSKYMPSTLEKNINAEGLNKYMTEVEKRLKLGFINDNTAVTTLLQHQKSAKDELSSLYSQLDKYLNKKENPSAHIDYIKLLQSIDTSKNKLYAIEQDILKERMNQLHEKRDKIQTYLNGILAKKTTKSNDEDIAELYYQSLFMYMDKQVEPAQFGARFLLVNEKMGNSVDFYCKSGKDRTGRMQNLIEELCQFSKEKGYFPRYDMNKRGINKDDETRQRAIAKTVSERTVSRDNADANALGARGLQITSALDLNTGLPNLSGSKMGVLAKRVYDRAAIKKRWNSLKQLGENFTNEVKSEVMSMKKRMKQIKPAQHSDHTKLQTKK